MTDIAVTRAVAAGAEPLFDASPAPESTRRVLFGSEADGDWRRAASRMDGRRPDDETQSRRGRAMIVDDAIRTLETADA